MSFYAPFALPFIVGTALLFLVVVWRYVSWFFALPKSDRLRFLRSLPTTATFKSLWEAVRECLLHVRIFKVDWRLGYMHASLAFGWFLLIAVGSLETIAYLGFEMVPPQGHVFFKYFAVQNGITEHKAVWDFVMDFLLAMVLSGVLLAWFKRLRSKSLGMRRTTKHIVGDKVALSFLWFIFPLRLIAESVTSALYGGGSFLTGSCGALLDRVFGDTLLAYAYEPAWWCYSIALGGFFVAMPFSRYMHIFTEIPLIFLRNAGLKVGSREKSYDNFEVQACSRCGVCIDPCQLQSVLNVNDVQSVYFVRDRRYNMLTLQTAQNCLMCGRCADRCPVGIDLMSLRLNSREAMRNIPAERRYGYFKGLDRSEGEGRVGYFAGCMTLLTPRTMTSMAQIFDAVNEQVWWADRDGGVCCGRPLKLSGEVDSARKMMHNTELFRKHNIRVLVTSCPICLKVFKEDYNLEGIEVLHHSEYIARLIASGRLVLNHTDDTFTYHDPCELGRGGGIYEAPRSVIESVGQLLETEHNRRDALCCGSSLANTVINDAAQLRIATTVTEELDRTGAQTIVTACPLCKKALSRSATHRVRDLSEIVARAIVR